MSLFDYFAEKNLLLCTIEYAVIDPGIVWRIADPSLNFWNLRPFSSSPAIVQFSRGAKSTQFPVVFQTLYSNQLLPIQGHML